MVIGKTQIVLVGGDSRQRLQIAKKIGTDVKVRHITQEKTNIIDLPQATHVFVYTRHLAHSLEDAVQSKIKPWQTIHRCSNT